MTRRVPTSSESEQVLRYGVFAAVKPLPKQLSRWLVAVAFFAAVSLLCGFFFFVHRNAAKAVATSSRDLPPAAAETEQHNPSADGNRPQGVCRSLRKYLDAGKILLSGDSVTVAAQKIDGTEDPYLYLGGIRGIAHCTFPVKPGEYEVHFYFAETSDLKSATRPVILSINAGTDINFDVVDSAGGDGIATSFVLTGIRPENDGMIHLEYTSDISLLNAVEILPADSENLLPVRIAASPFSIIDSANQLWLSDRYFIGGRRGQLPNPAKTTSREHIRLRSNWELSL